MVSARPTACYVIESVVCQLMMPQNGDMSGAACCFLYALLLFDNIKLTVGRLAPLSSPACRQSCIEFCSLSSADAHLPAVPWTASRPFCDRARDPADEDFSDEGPEVDVSPHIEAAARVLAAIRLWPGLPTASPAATECAALAVTCLEHGVGGSRPQLLVQAAQALSVPALKATMCAMIAARLAQ